MVHAGPGHLCAPTQLAIAEARKTIGKGERLEVLLHSPGGHPHVAYMAMRFFRSRYTEVNVIIIIPLVAKSAATLMCLGADHIFMGDLAELGPIDIQINDQVEHGAESFSPLNEFKSLEFLRDQALEWMEYYAVMMNHRYGLSVKEALRDSVPLVTGLMRPILEKIDPLDMGGHRRDLAVAEEYAKRMLMLTGNADARKIVRRLVWEYPSHDFYIDIHEALEIGLPVSALTENDGIELAEVLLELDNGDSYEGFPPAKVPPTGSAIAALPIDTQTPASTSAGGVNGSEANRQQQRVGLA